MVTLREQVGGGTWKARGWLVRTKVFYLPNKMCICLMCFSLLVLHLIILFLIGNEKKKCWQMLITVEARHMGVTAFSLLLHIFKISVIKSFKWDFFFFFTTYHLLVPAQSSNQYYGGDRL